MPSSPKVCARCSTAASWRWMASTSPFGAARCSACSGPTARARRRRSACSAACSSRPPARHSRRARRPRRTRDVRARSATCRSGTGCTTTSRSPRTCASTPPCTACTARRRAERLARDIAELGPRPSRRNQLAGTLSGGWKQRLALACATAHDPEMLFLDEPTAGVDPAARRRVLESIYELAHGGTTILVTTHYMDEAERCQRLAFLSRGHLIGLGTRGGDPRAVRPADDRGRLRRAAAPRRRRGGVRLLQRLRECALLAHAVEGVHPDAARPAHAGDDDRAPGHPARRSSAYAIQTDVRHLPTVVLDESRRRGEPGARGGDDRTPGTSTSSGTVAPAPRCATRSSAGEASAALVIPPAFTSATSSAAAPRRRRSSSTRPIRSRRPARRCPARRRPALARGARSSPSRGRAPPAARHAGPPVVQPRAPERRVHRARHHRASCSRSRWS